MFQSTRPARGATRVEDVLRSAHFVSIHAPRAGRDEHPQGECAGAGLFQSTRPARGATLDGVSPILPLPEFQSTRPARGATLDGVSPILPLPEFQSTRPARGATRSPRRTRPRCGVSIHAPRAGRDRLGKGTAVPLRSFNPRAPRGARRGLKSVKSTHALFQSTRPARGATRSPRRSWPAGWRFNPRAPRGARRWPDAHATANLLVSIHAPRAGRDVALGREILQDGVSIHAPRAGRDHKTSLP